MKKMMLLVFVCVGLGLLVGCDSEQTLQIPLLTKPAPQPEMSAIYTAQAVTIDGRLDEPVWKDAEVYQLSLSKADSSDGRKVQNPGEAQLAWDENYFYVAIRFYDSDLVAQGDGSDLHYYRYGDLFELFIKPENETWYWELYATPKSQATTFWFPGRGYLGLPSCFEYRFDLKVAAQVMGSLNDWKDEDKGWTAEMAVPVSELTSRGERFAPGASWRIMVSRYNYSRYLPEKELSMTPQLSTASYHRYEEYAKLNLVK